MPPPVRRAVVTQGAVAYGSSCSIAVSRPFVLVASTSLGLLSLKVQLRTVSGEPILLMPPPSLVALLFLKVQLLRVVVLISAFRDATTGGGYIRIEGAVPDNHIALKPTIAPPSPSALLPPKMQFATVRVAAKLQMPPPSALATEVAAVLRLMLQLVTVKVPLTSRIPPPRPAISLGPFAVDRPEMLTTGKAVVLVRWIRIMQKSHRLRVLLPARLRPGLAD
jgi:hypothetical protein